MDKKYQEKEVLEAQEGARLDAAIEVLVPGESLRFRRRLWDRYDILVNGYPRAKAYQVHVGQKLSLRLKETEQERSPMQNIPAGVRVVAQSTGVMAGLYKPSCVHSQAIAGKIEPSMESAIPAFWPNRFAELLNRLDYLTSGVVLVALCEESREQFREDEKAGAVRKHYFAVLHGELEEELVLRRKLDMAKRKKVRVLREDDEDEVRTTVVTPVEVRDGKTLAHVEICRGARHQIRAHCADAGYPLCGDPLYGEGDGDELMLHHFLIQFRDFQAFALPQDEKWSEWEKLLKQVAAKV